MSQSKLINHRSFCTYVLVSANMRQDCKPAEKGIPYHYSLIKEKKD